MTTMEQIESYKKEYRKKGYTEEKDFPGEYFFMFNPQTGKRVRLYYSGLVWDCNKLSFSS